MGSISIEYGAVQTDFTDEVVYNPDGFPLPNDVCSHFLLAAANIRCRHSATMMALSFVRTVSYITERDAKDGCEECDAPEAAASEAPAA